MLRLNDYKNVKKKQPNTCFHNRLLKFTKKVQNFYF